MKHQDFFKYIRYDNAVCILLGYDYCNSEKTIKSAKYVGYNEKHQNVVLLIKYDGKHYNIKYYVDFKLINNNDIVDNLQQISAADFLEKAKGRGAVQFRQETKFDMLTHNKFVKWNF